MMAESCAKKSSSPAASEAVHLFLPTKLYPVAQAQLKPPSVFVQSWSQWPHSAHSSRSVQVRLSLEIV